MQILSKYFEHLRQLKSANKSRQFAIEITIILIVKVILLWLIWAMFFSHPITREARQSEVTRIILNQTH
jgi:multidrug resistance efflux pump